MRHLLAILLLIASPVLAQNEIPEVGIDPRPYVEDLNAVAPYLQKAGLTLAEFAVVAAIACSNARMAMEDDVAARVRAWLSARYPTAAQIEQLDREAFVKFEDDLLAGHGASEAARAAVRDLLTRQPAIPGSPPAGNLDAGIAELAAICAQRGVGAAAPGDDASVSQFLQAQAVGKGILGLAVIIGDAAVTASTGGVAAMAFGIISGGWGYARFEESVIAFNAAR